MVVGGHVGIEKLGIGSQKTEIRKNRKEITNLDKNQLNQSYKAIEVNRFKSMSAEQKLNLSLQLYYSAKELKRSWLKMQHVDWTDQQIEMKLMEIFLYART